MNKYLILTLIIFTTSISCNNSNQNSGANSEEIKQTKGIESVKSNIENEGQGNTFDWTEIHLLKKNLLTELDPSKNNDKAIMRFLDKYEKLENKFNESLFDLSMYDSLSILVYSFDGVIYENALEFKKEVESNGFSIAHSEGMVYLTKNTEYIKSDVYELIDPKSIEFLDLYSKEIDSKCCEDAAIIITEKEVVQRAFLWGNFLEKSADLAYKSIARSELNTYLSLIYIGVDNTPSFDWSSKKYNQKYFDHMINIIEKYPNSIAAKEFKEYTDLLVAEKFKKTNKLDAFLEEKLNRIY